MKYFLPPARQRKDLLEIASGVTEEIFQDPERFSLAFPVDTQEIRRRVEAYDFSNPVPAKKVVKDVGDLLQQWSLQCSHPRYFGLFNPAPTYPGVLADYLVAAYNPQCGAWHHSPFAVEAERSMVRMFAGEFGFDPDTASGHFTSGGSEANTTAAIIALATAFPESRDVGLRGLPRQPVFYASQEYHHSFEKIAQQCGLGRNAVRLVPVRENLEMDCNSLQQMINNDRNEGFAPFLVVATAGTTNAGIIDPLEDIAAICTAERMQMHVDAAWGGAAILSPRYSNLLSGIDAADTITFDPHKLLSVPMAAGMILCRDGKILERAFGLDVAYVPGSPVEGLDNYQRSLQFSRRFIGLKLFMTLAIAGKESYAASIDHQFSLARELAQLLELDGWEIINGARLGIVCSAHPAIDQGRSNAARLTVYQQIENMVKQTGDAWISTTRIAGRPLLRVCITNYRTRLKDVERLSKLLARVLHKVLKQP